MKKVFIAIIAMVACFVGSDCVSAQTHYIVFKNGDSNTIKSFNETPKLVLNDGKWVLVNAEGTESSMAELKKISFKPVLKGDANVDEIVDVADITTIASYILGGKPETFLIENADANDDNIIDVADITTTASKILGKK